MRARRTRGWTALTLLLAVLAGPLHALELPSLCKETTTTQGTGTLTLAGAATDFRRLTVGLVAGGAGRTVHYTIRAGSVFERGEGVASITGGGVHQLTRVTVFESSNSNSLVNLGVGSKDVYISIIGPQALVRDSTGVVGDTSTDLHLKADDLTLEPSGAGKLIVKEPTFADSVLWTAARFAVTEADPGSITLGSLIVNWRTLNVASNTVSAAQTHDTAFPTAGLGCVCSFKTTDTGTLDACGFDSLTTTDVKFVNADAGAQDIFMVCLGY